MNTQTRFTKLPALAALVLLAGIGSAHAAITTYSGTDDGASTAGPWPNSAAAESALQAAASVYGLQQTITFEDLPTGYMANFSAAPNVGVALTGPDFGPALSGISDTTLGNLYGFNVTAGGVNWLGFPNGTATFTFDGGTNFFGAYFTGVQTVFTTVMTIDFFDGASQTLNVPINVDGGANYFGFTTSTSIGSLTITNISSDAWGIDNVTVSGVPEPTSVVLMLAGLGVLGAVARRRAGRSAP